MSNLLLTNDLMTALGGATFDGGVWGHNVHWSSDTWYYYSTYASSAVEGLPPGNNLAGDVVFSVDGSGNLPEGASVWFTIAKGRPYPDPPETIYHYVLFEEGGPTSGSFSFDLPTDDFDATCFIAITREGGMNGSSGGEGWPFDGSWYTESDEFSVSLTLTATGGGSGTCFWTDVVGATQVCG